MSGSRVNIPVGISLTILIRVEKSSWASLKKRIIIKIRLLVSIMAKMITDLALRSDTCGLMWWWEGMSTTTISLPSSAMSATTKISWSRVVAWSVGGGINHKRR